MIYVPTIHQSTVPEKSPRDLKMILTDTQTGQSQIFRENDQFQNFQENGQFRVFQENGQFRFSPTYFVFSANEQIPRFLFEK